MESGNGINSGKLKMPEGRERWKEEGRGGLEVIVQCSCIRTNCYEQVDTYAAKPHRERKEEENEVVVSYTGIRFEISADRNYAFGISNAQRKCSMKNNLFLKFLYVAKLL